MDWSEQELADHWPRWRTMVARNGGFDFQIYLEVMPFMKASFTGPWLKKMRLSSPLSAQEIAGNLGIRTSAYLRFEEREELGSISIANLQRCAAAMDCELVYALKPSCGRYPTRRMFDVIAPHVPRNSWPLYSLAASKFFKSEFRRGAGWVRNRVRPSRFGLI